MNTLLIVLQQQSNGLMNFLPLILIIVVFWFFMIRPQMKRQKELKNFRDSLKKGDKIVTTGGIYGKVLEIGDYYIIMEVAGKRGRWRCGVCRKYNFETARGYSGNERENPRIQSKVLGLSFKYNHNIMEI